MFGIPLPYQILAVFLLGLGLLTAGELHGRAAERKTWELASARQGRDAAALLDSERAHSAAIDAKNADLANKLDSDHAKAIADIDATRADFLKRLRLASSGKGDSCSTTAQAVNPSVSQGITAEDRFRGVNIDAGEQLRDYVSRLWAYAESCHAFAIQVGR